MFVTLLPTIQQEALLYLIHILNAIKLRDFIENKWKDKN